LPDKTAIGNYKRSQYLLMQKNLSRYIVCFLGILLFTTCKKSKPTPAAVITGMSFKVDGVLNTMGNASAIMSNSAHIINISGTTTNGPYPGIVIALTNPVVGTNSPFSLQYLAAASDQYTFTPGSESVIITSLTNSNVTGTFQFSCTSLFVYPPVTKVITEGTFNCPVTQEN
jgi:hypothetical protein